MTTTTAAHPPPTWAADPGTDVVHERGEAVHPDDAHTSYTRQFASWETTPSRSTLQVTLHAWRPDDGKDDLDTACVCEDGRPGQHLAADDARRLGHVLLRAADELEGRDGERRRKPGPVSVHPECTPPLLDSPEAAAAEVAWVAREARALLEARAGLTHGGQAPDPEREARFTARRRALLAYIERREAQR